MGNFFSAVLMMFRPQKTANKVVNRSRLFNSYDSIFEILIAIMNYSVFSMTNQMTLIHFYLIGTFLSIAANYIAHIGLAMRFIYSAFISIFAGGYIMVLQFIVLTRTFNVNKICLLLDVYYTKYTTLETDKLDLCKKQRNLYILWLGIELICVSLKILGIYFAIKAHAIVKKQRKVRKKRKARNK